MTTSTELDWMLMQLLSWCEVLPALGGQVVVHPLCYKRGTDGGQFR